MTIINKNSFNLIFSILITISLWSCKEKISSKKMVSGAKFGANISLNTSLKEETIEDIQIRLFDVNNNTVASDSLKLYINNSLLDLSGGTKQRYYHSTSHYAYYTDSVPKSDHYSISIILEDGIKKEIASYIPLKKEDIKYNIKENNNTYNFNWEIATVVDSLSLRLFKTNYITKDSLRSEYKDSVIIKKLSPTKGIFKLDKSFFKNNNYTITTYFSANVAVRKHGLINKILLSKSSIIGNTGFTFNTEALEEKYIKSAY